MNKKLVLNKEKIADFCERHHIHRLAIFGSALRGDFGPGSDVDVLVDFMPGHTPGFFRLFDMEEELSSLFGDYKVDMRTPEDLSRYFRDEVVATAEVQYVQE
ncbi:MAG: nucleotidyltransferase family protein [Planctomycetes bacterium]|nr:nucleotidyltransferase family protein [Planctomycetota bacterium]